MTKTIYPLLTVAAIGLITPIAASSAQSYQTYVIDTYGGAALLPAVRQQLAGSGSSAAVYQDKLVLRTTAQGYQAVQQLLRQIDGAPQALTVLVRVGNQGSSNSSIGQSQIIITSNGERVNVGGYGRFGTQAQAQQGNSLYQVQTLSGKPASIGTSTLLSLAQPWLLPYGTGPYHPYGQPSARVIIYGHVLATASQGIAVTPRLLPNGQIQVGLNQVQQQVTGSRQTPIDSQGLQTTVIVPRGQWVDIGSVSQQSDKQSLGSNGSWQQSGQTSYPIQIKVQ